MSAAITLLLSSVLAASREFQIRWAFIFTRSCFPVGKHLALGILVTELNFRSIHKLAALPYGSIALLIFVLHRHISYTFIHFVPINAVL